MTYKIPRWISFTGEQEKNKILVCTECSVKQQLKELTERYHIDNKELHERQEDLISHFELDENEKRYVRYGVVEPFNMSYKKFVDIINNDIYITKLSEDINNVLLEGNLLIIQLLINKSISPPGYNVYAFVEKPQYYQKEIYNLVLSLSGYEHIHIYDDLILFELPARVYLSDYPEIRRLVDLWINGLGLITKTSGFRRNY